MAINSLTTKLKNAIRIDRAIRFVWQASPLYAILSAATAAVLGVLPLISLYLIKRIIDETTGLVFKKDGVTGDLNIVWLLIGITCFIGILTAFFNFLADYIRRAQTLVVADHVFATIHAKSVESDLELYESPENRDILYRAQVEGPYRPVSIVRGLFSAGHSFMAFTGVAGLMIMLNPWLLVLIIIATIPGILLRLRYSSKIYDWQQKRTGDERKASYLHNILTNEIHAKELRLFDLGSHFIRQFKNIRALLNSEKLQLEKKRAAGDLIAQSCAAVAASGCFIYITVKTVSGTITIGDMVMYFQAFTRGVGFLRTLLESGAQMYEDNLFLSYLEKFLSIRPKIISPGKNLPLPSEKCSGFQFKNVDFFYPKYEKKVLKYVNFSINPGEIVAVVGSNGSGKSTILKLLSRLYDPSKGNICYEGVDIRQFDPKKYRKKISVLFQDHVHYYLSVEENIAMGELSKKAGTCELTTAATKSGIHDIIKTLPEGYETLLGRMFQGGQELSIGQWQMLAIARAFFRDSELIVLDEPSSALDPEAESQIFSRLRDLIQGKSALIISHRYASVKMADKILVVENGQILEQGNHKQLMTLNGRYAHLYRAQADNFCQNP